MNALSLDAIRKIHKKGPAVSKNRIRVNLDTGGIAAGADEVYAKLVETAKAKGLEIEFRRAGSLGLAYLDPVVEVETEGMPPVLYGEVNPEAAERIITDHVQAKRLVDSHILATTARSGDLSGETQFILVKDTSCEDSDKTSFFRESLEKELSSRGLSEKVQVLTSLDMRLYDQGVTVQLLPSGVTYTNVLAPDVARLVEESIQGGKVIEDLLFNEPDKQHRIVLRNCGIVDPEDLQDYLAAGGYAGLAKAITDCTPEEVIETMKTSGLRGRGGAGFPTWLKWNLTRQVEGGEKYVICNADEGDPGAFMDRSVLEGDPHSVIEGLALAAYCIGANKGFLYIRAEYPLAIKRVQIALDQAREAGLLGENILGSNFCFDAKIRLGAGAFVCGEETALIASIEGKRGSPNPRPPYPAQKGLWGKPTSINNVETLAAVSHIVAHGGEEYAALGMDKSKGTKVFAVTGKVRNAQLVEVPMGVTLREIVFDVCGGVLDHHEIKAVQTGGPSGGVIPEQKLDTPLSYETLQQLGSIMGSGGMLVMDQNDDMVDVAKFYLRFCVEESCGKCAPCRVGGYQMLQLLDLVSRGRAKTKDIETIERICESMQKASLCGLGQTAPNPVLSTLNYFRSEYDAFLEGGVAYARKLKKQREKASA